MSHSVAEVDSESCAPASSLRLGNSLFLVEEEEEKEVEFFFFPSHLVFFEAIESSVHLFSLIFLSTLSFL